MQPGCPLSCSQDHVNCLYPEPVESSPHPPNLFPHDKLIILYSQVGFEVLTAVSTKMAVFWVVAPCSPVIYQRDALMMEAARTSETLVNFYQTTRHYNPEDSHLHITFPSTLVFQVVSSNHNFVRISHLPHARYMSRPSHPPWFHVPNNIWGKVWIMKSLITPVTVFSSLP
jgi:hypothetical protein